MSTSLGMKRNRVYVEQPSIQSRAALVLLVKELREQEIKTWLEFRLQFLGSRKLICHYCGKEGLQIDADPSKREELKVLATVDHVIPISKGGAMYDENNCVVACFSCNQKKGNNENFNTGRH
jgi:5-methylcytosine-specific restriction endonuclease McrA